MAYKSGGVEKIKDNKTVVFNDVTVKNFYTLTKGIGTDTSTGYTVGGFSNPTTAFNTIDSYPVASDTNATDVGNLTQSRSNSSSACSSTHAYTSAGQIPTTTIRNTIDKFPFASSGNATDVGDLTVARRNVGGNQDGANTINSTGYVTGGQNTPTGSPTFFNVIDSFPFAADGNASDAGDLSTGLRQHASQSSDSHAYSSGGATPPPTVTNAIEKFPFASVNTSSDVGDLTQARRTRGMSSQNNGYSAGSLEPPYSNTVIDKFPFSTDANATDVGDLSINVGIPGTGNGTSSEDHGYNAGGITPAGTPTLYNVIQKFSFTTDGNSTDVGNLTQSRGYTCGHQG